MRKTLLRLGAALAIVLGAGAAAVTTSASSQAQTTQARVALSPIVEICTTQNTDHCLNRNHGTTSFGTHVITWHNGDNNNDFTFALENVSYCGGTNWVHNGENGLVCPFTNGSGLNARYDHKGIYFIHAFNEANTCAVVDDFSLAAVDLGACGASGYLWVLSPNGSGGAYVVNVGMSNFRYSQGDGSNRPWWMYDLGIGNRVVVNPTAVDSHTLWGCVGGHVDSC